MSLAAMRLIGFILGIFLITLAVSMAIPMITLVAFERSDDLSAFTLPVPKRFDLLFSLSSCGGLVTLSD